MSFVTKSHLSVDMIISLFLFFQIDMYFHSVTVTKATKALHRLMSLLSLSQGENHA
jgi:hypothetical protein